MNEWVKDMLIRALKTVIQTALGMLGATVALSDIDIPAIIVASLSAGLLSIVMSICSRLGIDTEDDI